MSELIREQAHELTGKTDLALGQSARDVRWTTAGELTEIAQPLLESPAFRRLDSITFLGILSPRYAGLRGAPFRPLSGQSDGSRWHHSIGVARIALDVARSVHLSPEAMRYAVAWGLIHDIGTWPLSHTGEAAFTIITKHRSSEVRRKIIQGSSDLPERFSVNRQLLEMGVDPAALLELFGDDAPGDLNRKLLWEILRSPITPDSIEGMSRAGAVFGVAVPAPEHVYGSLSRNMFECVIGGSQSAAMLSFWRKKSRIYRQYINAPSMISWESRWSLAIVRCCTGMTLADSLEIPEPDLIALLEEQELPSADRLVRYKHPLIYRVDPIQRNRIRSGMLISLLSSILRKTAVPDSLSERMV